MQDTHYIIRLLLAIDQLLNVLLCNGSPDETMSAASYRMHRDGRFWGFMMPVIDLLFWWQGPNHCRNAYLKELDRSQYPAEYKNTLERNPSPCQSQHLPPQ